MVVVNGGLDIRCELTRLEMLDIFDQVVVILGLDSLLELGEFIVNLFDNLASDLNNFKLLVEVGNVLSENFFKTNELLHFIILSLKVHEGAESCVSS
jgi:hypothetical protein